MFATRPDLLARSNANRLAQLAVPADCDMVSDEALRIAIAGGDLTAYSTIDQATLALALTAIDNALADASALMAGYGVPDTVQTPLLARLASTIALYYLQGTGRMSEDVTKAYDATIKTLESFKKGLVSLIPVSPSVPVAEIGAGAEIGSGHRRYSWGQEQDFYDL